MPKRPRLKRILWAFAALLLIALLAFAIPFCKKTFPIISGYTAKMMCSEVFVGGRDPREVAEKDLKVFPLNLSSCEVDFKDSSVTANVFGLSRRKAIFRRGLGATLISQLTEDSLRRQSFLLPQPPAVNTAEIAWPMGDKLADSLPSNVDKARLQVAVDDFFAEPDKKHKKITRALLVVYKGQIIAERYAKPFSKDSRFLGWSIAKSVTSTLIGILVKEGLLKPDADAPVAAWSTGNDPRHSITVKNLLQQVSGLHFAEDYSKSSDATIMLYQKADMAAFAASRKLDTMPGTRFRYSSGNSNLLSAIVRTTVKADYHAFPYTSLFYKLGMYHTVWEPDESGTYVGSSYLYASARDWARFGMLYLNNGYCNKEQLLPADWVSNSAMPLQVANFDHYGYQFWLNTGRKGGKGKKNYPHAPDDMYYADGYNGQNLFLMPSQDLLVVRLGMTTDGGYHADRSLKLLLDAIRQ